MRALESLLSSLKGQRSALNAIFCEFESSPHSRMAMGMFDLLLSEVEDITGTIRSRTWENADGKALVRVDEEKLQVLFGKDFARRVESISDLASQVVEQLCVVADGITNDARAELGLPAMRLGTPLLDKLQGKPESDEGRRVAGEESCSQVAAHGREFIGVSLRDYACSLETMLQSLPNLFYGAALLSFSSQMSPAPDSK